MAPRALRRGLPALIAASLLGACAGAPQPARPDLGGHWLVDGLLIGPTMPAIPVSPVPRPAAATPQIALVLGGGGLRGFAHIGVLQALEEAGIRPDLVVGSSIGAIIGAAYASGRSPQQLWQEAHALKVHALADLAVSGPGWVKGEALAHWADRLVGGRPIERFPTRFAAVATDLDLARPFVITRGPAGLALRASAAIPGIFLPVEAGGLTLVDGGVTALVPVRAARALGADLVIAVDIYCHGPRYPTSSAVSIGLRVSQAQSCLLAGPEAASAHVLVAPAIAPASLDDAKGRERVRQQGYDAALAQIPALRAALQAAERQMSWR